MFGVINWILMQYVQNKKSTEGTLNYVEIIDWWGW